MTFSESRFTCFKSLKMFIKQTSAPLLADIHDGKTGTFILKSDFDGKRTKSHWCVVPAAETILRANCRR